MGATELIATFTVAVVVADDDDDVAFTVDDDNVGVAVTVMVLLCLFVTVVELLMMAVETVVGEVALGLVVVVDGNDCSTGLEVLFT